MLIQSRSKLIRRQSVDHNKIKGDCESEWRGRESDLKQSDWSVFHSACQSPLGSRSGRIVARHAIALYASSVKCSEVFPVFFILRHYGSGISSSLFRPADLCSGQSEYRL